MTLHLEHWHDFSLLVGTAAATLMGLTFVAVSLAPDVIADRTTTVVRAFTTPIVAFFATDLILSVLLLVPDLPRTAAAAFFAAAGSCGVAYVFSTGAHRQWRELELGVDDWIWYFGLPLAGYAGLLVPGILLWFPQAWCLYAVAGAQVLLLVVGVRNAWDVVIAIVQHAHR